ncbi:MAG TPA: hypothetical protein VF957_23610 [Bradyrhizobium sp.]
MASERVFRSSVISTTDIKIADEILDAAIHRRRTLEIDEREFLHRYASWLLEREEQFES